MTLRGLLLALVLGAGASRAAEAPPPADVASVDELFRLVRRDSPRAPLDGAELEQALARALGRTCEAASREMGLGTTDVEVLAALRASVREATTRPLAVELLGRWLNLPAVAEPFCQKGEDAGGLAPGDRARLLASQLRTRKPGGPLSVVPAASQVAAEVGGNCAGAGLLEAGEWVRLAVAVENRSDRPWLTTTALPEAEGGCVWVDALEPVAVGEMARGERSLVPVWVYLARTCPAPMEARLRLHLRDMRRPDVSASQVQVDLQPLAMGVPRVARERLEVDGLVLSEGGGETELRPARRFEYAVDLAMADADVHALRMAYRVAPDALALFESLAFREGLKMERASDGLFRAMDDLDGRVVSEAAFRQVMQGVQGSGRWLVTGKQGRLWLALDVDVELHPGALVAPSRVPAPAKGAPVATRPVRGRGRVRTPDVAPAATAREPPPASQVVGLVRKYLSPAPRAAEARAAAASCGEVVFDADGFRSEYDALLAPGAPSSTAAPGPASLTYRVRTFRSLPVLAVPRPETPLASSVPAAFKNEPAPVEALAPRSEPASGVVPAPRGEPTPSVAAAPRGEPVPALPLVRIDAGGGLLAYAVTAPSGLPSYWGGLRLLGALEGRLRASVGRNLVAMVSLAYGAGNARTQGRPQAPGGLREGTVEAGIGYLFTPAGFELMPYAFVDGRMRLLEGTSEPARTFNAGVGGTARYFPWQQVGLFLDVAYRLGPPTHKVQGVDVAAGGGPRLGTGVSVRF